MPRFYLSARARLGVALVLSSTVSLGLYLAGSFANHDAAFSYLPWNLFLAWIPLVLSLWLERVLRHTLWSGWYALAITMVWLGFLPNSFYMISDFVHIQEVTRVDLLYDVAMFSSFIFNGVVLGFLSVVLVHQELLKRVSKRISGALVALVLLLCSFAIYIGRDLRWNTWDVLVNPSALLFDITDRLLNPTAHPQAFTTTVSFFVLLGSLYIVAWQLIRVSRATRATE